MKILGGILGFLFLFLLVTGCASTKSNTNKHLTASQQNFLYPDSDEAVKAELAEAKKDEKERTKNVKVASKTAHNVATRGVPTPSSMASSAFREASSLLSGFGSMGTSKTSQEKVKDDLVKIVAMVLGMKTFHERMGFEPYIEDENLPVEEKDKIQLDVYKCAREVRYLVALGIESLVQKYQDDDIAKRAIAIQRMRNSTFRALANERVKVAGGTLGPINLAALGELPEFAKGKTLPDNEWVILPSSNGSSGAVAASN
ncbi:MAG: hypothetical protein SGJ02_10250 [bacterium]|nr:hypothetical protein [bacterium]